MAYEEPSGLMGKPQNMEQFMVFSVQDIVFYIDKSILEEYLDKNRLLINIEGYGHQSFMIEE